MYLKSLWGIAPGLIREAEGAAAWETTPEGNPFRCGDSSWEQRVIIRGKVRDLLALRSLERTRLLLDLREGCDDDLYPGYLACLWDLCSAGSWKRLGLLVRYWLEVCPSCDGVRTAIREEELMITPCGRMKDVAIP